MTIDVEDYYHVSGFERSIDRRQWGSFESRIEASTGRILELLSDHDVRATFYILGWVADRFPGLVREIHRLGHEIASHSYWHRLVYELSPDEFREDLRNSRDVLEEITGQRVTSFRAASFSITRRSLWALEILVEEGFESDSSIFPIYHDRYGIPSAQPRLHRIQTPSGPIWEFPTSVMRLGRVNLPVSGGGYFRLYPWKFTERCLQRVAQSTGEPFVFYTHPWEFDPGQPRMSLGSWQQRFRHYVNLGKTADKFDTLLERFGFGRVSDVLAGAGHRGQDDPVELEALSGASR